VYGEVWRGGSPRREVGILQDIRCGKILCGLACLTAIVATTAIPSSALQPLSASRGNHSGSRIGTAAKGVPVQLMLVPMDSHGTMTAALTYPHRVAEAEARQDLGQLSTLTGWRISGISISNNPETREERLSTTSVEFSVSNALFLQTSTLPVEPLIIALKRFKSIVLIFAMRRDYLFQGMGDYENDFVDIRYGSIGQTHTYRVSVKRTDFSALGLPTTVRPASQASPAPRGTPWAVMWPLVISVLIGIGVWMALVSVRRRKAC